MALEGFCCWPRIFPIVELLVSPSFSHRRRPCRYNRVDNSFHPLRSAAGYFGDWRFKRTSKRGERVTALRFVTSESDADELFYMRSSADVTDTTRLRGEERDHRGILFAAVALRLRDLSVSWSPWFFSVVRFFTSGNSCRVFFVCLRCVDDDLPSPRVCAGGGEEGGGFSW